MFWFRNALRARWVHEGHGQGGAVPWSTIPKGKLLRMSDEQSATACRSIALISITEERRRAELASRHLADDLRRVGEATPVRQWTTQDRWIEVNSGQVGNRAAERVSPVVDRDLALPRSPALPP